MMLKSTHRLRGWDMPSVTLLNAPTASLCTVYWFYWLVRVVF
jgi:hypothetical protein